MFQIGEIVRFDPDTIFGRKRKIPEGIDPKKKYTIKNIHYGIDGAFDWDDLFFEEISGKFCEFDFERVRVA